MVSLTLERMSLNTQVVCNVLYQQLCVEKTKSIVPKKQLTCNTFGTAAGDGPESPLEPDSTNMSDTLKTIGAANATVVCTATRCDTRMTLPFRYIRGSYSDMDLEID